MSAGRRNLFQQHATEENFEQRFRFMLERVEKGKASFADMAKTFNVNERTIRRNAELLKKKDYATNTFAPTENWENLPELAIFKQRFAIGAKDDNSRNYKLKLIKGWWETIWGKRPLSTLTEQDFLNARTQIDKQIQGGGRFGAVCALRLLVIHGIAGNHAWLKGFLSTKGLKTKAELPPEIKIRSIFETVLPRLRKRVYLMAQEGRPVRMQTGKKTGRKPVTLEEAEEVELIEVLKWVTKIRTGDRKKEFELWGTRIGTGKSPIYFDANGEFVNWDITAKRSEHWHVTRDTIPPAANRLLNDFVRKRGLKTGDYLINIQQPRAGQIRDAQFSEEGFSAWNFHDFRKAGLTSEKRAGVPLEVAVDRNVGWLDMNTAKSFYLAIDAFDATEATKKVSTYLNLD
jgi:hypothetical protein